MYFICVIRKKGSKSFFLLHLLTNTGERIALFQNDIYETVRPKNESSGSGVKKSFFATRTLQKV